MDQPFTMRELKRKIDLFAHPPTRYIVRGYRDQIKTFFDVLKSGKKTFSTSIALFALLFAIVVGLLMTPICGLIYLLGFRFLNIDLSQIGSIFWLDLYLKENSLKEKRPKWKIFVPRSTFIDANQIAFDAYKDHATFVSHPLLKFLLLPFFTNHFFHTNIFKYDPCTTFHCENDSKMTAVHELFKEWRSKNSHPLFRLSSDQMEKGQRELLKIAPDDKPFICMHVRESGFNKSYNLTTRNGDIQSNILAMRFLINQGYRIIRMGDETMSDISELLKEFGSDLIDYAHSEIRSELMDCYLLSKCEFFFGGASGLTFFAYVVGIPVCTVNWYNASVAIGFSPDDLTCFKYIKNEKTGELVDFYDLMKLPYKRNFQSGELIEMGLIIEDNMPEEILETIKEFMDKTRSDKYNFSENIKNKTPAGCYNHQGNGNFSKAVLKKYFDMVNCNDK